MLPIPESAHQQMKQKLAKRKRRAGLRSSSGTLEDRRADLPNAILEADQGNRAVLTDVLEVLDIQEGPACDAAHFELQRERENQSGRAESLQHCPAMGIGSSQATRLKDQGAILSTFLC